MPTASNHCATSRLRAAAAGDEEPEATAEPLSDSGEHQPVRYLVLQRQRQRGLRARPAWPGTAFQAHRDRPVEDSLLEPALLGDHAPRCGHEPSRKCAGPHHDSRTHEQRGSRRSCRRDRRSPSGTRRQRQRQHHLAEGMRQWQPQGFQVVRAKDVQGVIGSGGVASTPRALAAHPSACRWCRTCR